MAQTSTLGQTWVLQRPSPTGENLRSVAHNGRLAVTVGQNNVTTYAVVPASDFVAVGGNGTVLTAAGISTSIAWNANTVPSGTGDLKDVVFTGAAGGNKYIAVGSLGSILIANDTLSGTPAVLTWAKATTVAVATDTYYAVTALGSLYVVAGATTSGGGVVVVSTDSGANWSRRLVANSTTLKDVAIAPGTSTNSIYVLMDGALLASTNNGLSWTSVALANTTATSLAYAALPTSSTSTLNITGSTNWQINGSTLAVNSLTPFGIPATSTTTKASGMPITWSLDELVGISRDSNTTSPTSSLQTSTTGSTWISVSSTTNVIFNRAVKYADRSYLAVGNGGAIYFYIEGGSWTPLTSSGSTAYDAQSIAWNQRYDPAGSLTVAVGNGISWTSTDLGATWTEHLQAGLNMLSVMWSGSFFVAGGNGLWVSTDGINWQSKVNPPTPKNTGDPTVFSVARLFGNSGSTPLALGYDYTRKLAMIAIGDSSGFGWSNFTAISGGSSWAMLAVTKKEDSSQYVAVGWGGRVLVTSTPSSTWTQYVVSLASGEDFTDVVWANDQYTAVTSKGGIWTSVNGSTWVKRFSASQALWCLTRVKHPGKTNDQFIAAGDHGVLATSYEGKIWTEGTLGTSLFTNQIAWIPSGNTVVTTHFPSSSILTTTTTSYSLNTSNQTLTTTVEVDTTTTTNVETTTVSTLNDNVVVTANTPKLTSQNVVTNKGTPSSTTAASQLTTAPATTVSPVTTAGTPPADTTVTSTGNERLLTIGGTGAVFASTGVVNSEPTISFETDSTSVPEGTESVPINVTLSTKIPSAKVTVTFDFSASTALSSTYTPSVTSLTWDVNSNDTKQFTITAKNDFIDRNNAKVIIKLKSANINGADVGVGAHPTHAVTIVDNDHAPNSTVAVSSPLVYVGSAVTLSSTLATGVSGIPTWQWLKNGVAIPGATQATFFIPSATLANAGTYSLVGTNAAGKRTSNTVQLAVLDGSDQTIAYTTFPTLSLPFSGGTGITYQWSQIPAGTLSGFISSTLPTSGLLTQAKPAGQFTCQVTSGTTMLTTGIYNVFLKQSLNVTASCATPFVTTGSTVTILGTVVTSPTGPVTWQWYKNGLAIPGASQSFYQIPSATLASAGTYKVKATSPAGTGTSDSIFISVLDTIPQAVFLKPSSKTTIGLKLASVAGTSFTYQWSQSGSGILPGVVFSTYQIPSVSGTGVYTCAVKLGGTTLTSGQISVVATSASQKPTITAAVFSQGQVGHSYTASPTASNTPNQWTIAGLPTGLTYDRATGAVSGIPRASGTFNVTLTATNAGGSNTPYPVSLVVTPIQTGTSGSFMGIVDAENTVNLGLAERLDVTVTAAGTFTGKLTEATNSVSFMGDLNYTNPYYTGTVILPSGKEIDLTINGSGGEMTGNVKVGSATAAINGWVKTAAGIPLSGKYTVTLSPSAATGGSGYGFITVDTTGTVTMTGRLPDGITTPIVTSSGFIGHNGLTGVFVPIYDSTGTLQGRMNLNAGNGPAYLDNYVTGTLNNGRIVSPATTATSVALTMDGGRYIAPISGTIVMNLPSTSASVANANLTFLGADLASATNIPDCTYAINSPAAVLVVGSNPANTSLWFNPATGEFTGMFTRDSTGPRTAAYYGVLIRPSGSAIMVGKGFFFELDTSTPPVNLVGSVNLKKL